MGCSAGALQYFFLLLYAFAGSVWGALRGPCNRNISRVCEVSHAAREPNCQLFGYVPGTGDRCFCLLLSTCTVRVGLFWSLLTLVRTSGKYLAYEIAVGANGRVWVKSASVGKTIMVANALRNAEYLAPERAEAMVAQLVSFLEG